MAPLSPRKAAARDIIVYRLSDGPFAGKYVYVVENITIGVRAGQTVRAGERIATLHLGSPNLEIGWASGHGAETLAAARGHKCSCRDPGGWSSIEGRNFDELLVWLGAPSGYTGRAAKPTLPSCHISRSARVIQVDPQHGADMANPGQPSRLRRSRMSTMQETNNQATFRGFWRGHEHRRCGGRLTQRASSPP
jgi:hypothetical protein